GRPAGGAADAGLPRRRLHRPDAGLRAAGAPRRRRHAAQGRHAWPAPPPQHTQAAGMTRAPMAPADLANPDGRRRRLLLAGSLAGLLPARGAQAAQEAQAQAAAPAAEVWPRKPLRLIVVYPPGGVSDL